MEPFPLGIFKVSQLWGSCVQQGRRRDCWAGGCGWAGAFCTLVRHVITFSVCCPKQLFCQVCESHEWQKHVSILVLAQVCSSLTAEVQNRNTCNDFHRDLLAFWGMGRKQKLPSPRSDAHGARVSCP